MDCAGSGPPPIPGPSPTNCVGEGRKPSPTADCHSEGGARVVPPVPGSVAPTEESTRPCWWPAADLDLAHARVREGGQCDVVAAISIQSLSSFRRFQLQSLSRE